MRDLWLPARVLHMCGALDPDGHQALPRGGYPHT